MTVIKPALAPAKPGLPITADAWNAVVDAVEGLGAAIGEAALAHVEVSVTDRGVPVTDARVVAIPLDPTGASLTASPAPDGGATHTLAGLRGGRWRILVEALGYAPETRELSVDPASSAPAEPLRVQPKRTSVPAPDLLGLGMWAALEAVRWMRLDLGDLKVLDLAQGQPIDSSVVMQSPAGGQIARGTMITGLTSGSAPASRTVVPELLGLTQYRLGFPAVYFLFAADPPSDSSNSAMRVFSQSQRAGEIVAPNSKIGVTYGSVDAGMTFGAYTGTHPKLSGAPVQAVVDKVVASAGLSATAAWTPWEIARTYADDDYLVEVLELFPTLRADIATATSADLEAIWRSFMVALHWTL